MSDARELLLLRHGATEWNLERRIQGRRDIPLSDAGRQWLQGCRMPPGWESAHWVSSPLRRALDTARALGAETVTVATELTEMDWGEWEGEHLADLRRRHGEAMRANESRGLDFRPAGGESPRQVRDRVAGWVRGLDPGGAPLLVVTHKGVLRAALSLATGWDMRQDHRPKPDWQTAQHFRREQGGRLVLVQLNVSLTGAP